MKEKMNKFMHWFMNSKAPKDGIVLENIRNRQRSDNIQLVGGYVAIAGIMLNSIGKILEYRNQASGTVEEFIKKSEKCAKESKMEEKSSEE